MAALILDLVLAVALCVSVYGVSGLPWSLVGGVTKVTVFVMAAFATYNVVRHVLVIAYALRVVIRQRAGSEW